MTSVLTDTRPRIAVISDIHANADALEAVLADIDLVGADTLWVLGDICGNGPDSAAVVDMLRARRPGLVLAGGQDAHIAETVHGLGIRGAAAVAAEHARDALDAHQLKWLSLLPVTGKTERIGRRTQVHTAHATFDDPLWGAGDQLAGVRARVAARDARSARRAAVWLAGATHIPRATRAQPREISEKQNAGLRAAVHNEPQHLRTGDWLINPGAVGVAGAGDSAAWWALVSFAGARKVTFRRVRYDTRPVVQRVAAAGLPPDCAWAIDPRARAA